MNNQDQNNQFDVPLELKNRALASTAEGIVISNPNLPGNPIIYVNSGFQHITGFSPNDVLGKNCRFLQGPETDEKSKQIIRNAIAKQTHCTVEILNYKKDGTRFWNRLSITPIRDDSGSLTHFIGVQSDITTRRNAELALQNANDQLKKNLNMAAGIQRSLLPKNMPTPKALNFAWKFIPCEELAGDTLNIFYLDPDHIALYIIDVSGHGVPSALLSFSLTQILTPNPETSSLFHPKPNSDQYQISSPVQVLERLNKRFPIDYEIGQYFTIIYGIIDLRTNILTFASAGHPGPVLTQKNSAPNIIQTSSFPIGFSKNPQYTQTSIQLKPDDRIFLYTDGITEALSTTDKLFGQDRFLKNLQKNSNLDLEKTIEKLIQSLQNWSCHKKLRDDISILAMQINSNPQIMYHL